MTNDREKIISKIKKLLALAADNSNTGECIAAALKAQKLIAQYNVEDFELAEKRDETIEHLASTSYVGKSWRYVLANIIADNFRCKCYTLDSAKDQFWRQGKQHQQVFIGYKSDAHAALLVYEKLADFGESKAREMCRKAKEQYGTSQGVKNSFLVGFCYGVKEELEKQAQALMLVTPGLVKAEFDNLDLEYGEGLYLSKPTLDYTDEGTTAGRDAVRSSRLDGHVAKAEYLLTN